MKIGQVTKLLQRIIRNNNVTPKGILDIQLNPDKVYKKRKKKDILPNQPYLCIKLSKKEGHTRDDNTNAEPPAVEKAGPLVIDV